MTADFFLPQFSDSFYQPPTREMRSEDPFAVVSTRTSYEVKSNRIRARLLFIPSLCMKLPVMARYHNVEHELLRLREMKGIPR
jgi:hypothetical protein